MTLQQYKDWLAGFLTAKEGTPLTSEDTIKALEKLELVEIPNLYHQYPEFDPTWITYTQPTIDPPNYKPDITCEK